MFHFIRWVSLSWLESTNMLLIKHWWTVSGLNNVWHLPASLSTYCHLGPTIVRKSTKILSKTRIPLVTEPLIKFRKTKVRYYIYSYHKEARITLHFTSWRSADGRKTHSGGEICFVSPFQRGQLGTPVLTSHTWDQMVSASPQMSQTRLIWLEHRQCCSNKQMECWLSVAIFLCLYDRYLMLYMYLYHTETRLPWVNHTTSTFKVYGLQSNLKLHTL